MVVEAVWIRRGLGSSGVIGVMVHSGLSRYQLAHAPKVGSLPLTHHFKMQRPPAEVALS